MKTTLISTAAVAVFALAAPAFAQEVPAADQAAAAASATPGETIVLDETPEEAVPAVTEEALPAEPEAVPAAPAAPAAEEAPAAPEATKAEPAAEPEPDLLAELDALKAANAAAAARLAKLEAQAARTGTDVNRLRLRVAFDDFSAGLGMKFMSDGAPLTLNLGSGPLSLDLSGKDVAMTLSLVRHDIGTAVTLKYLGIGFDAYLGEKRPHLPQYDRPMDFVVRPLDLRVKALPLKKNGRPWSVLALNVNFGWQFVGFGAGAKGAKEEIDKIGSDEFTIATFDQQGVEDAMKAQGEAFQNHLSDAADAAATPFEDAIKHPVVGIAASIGF